MDSTERFTAQPVFTLNPSDESGLIALFRVVIPHLITQRFHISLVFTEVLPCDRWAKEVVDRPDDITCIVVDRGDLLDHLPAIRRSTDITFIISAEVDRVDIPAIAFKPGAGVSEPLMGAELLTAQVREVTMEREVWGCVLIGGKSSRMGRPKHLITTPTGETWLERVVAILHTRLAGVAISGVGDIPENIGQPVRLADVPEGQGPLTGIASAMRWRPDVNWLVVACDMPGVTVEAIDWLLGTRIPGRWASVPRLPGKERGEPLFALYGPPCGPLFERMLAEGSYAIQGICRSSRVDLVEIPEDLKFAWSNVNTPEELHVFNREK